MSVLLAAVTGLVFGRAVFCDFVKFDDDDYFTSNSHVLSGLSWKSAAWAFHTGHASNWHPLTWLSLMLDAELFGSGPAGPHLTNVLLHTANAILLFVLLRRMTGAHWRSAVVAALFALHPLHVESVAWVSERKDVLSAFFGLLALIFYARYVQKAQSDQQTRRTSNARSCYWSAVFLFALGLMSKPMLVTLPFAMLLLDWWPLQRVSGVRYQVSVEAEAAASSLQRSRLWLLVEKLPFFALSAGSCVVTFLVQNRSGAVHSFDSIPLGPRVENAFVSYARYLYKTIRPGDLAIYYPHPGHWSWDRVALGVALVFGVGLVALWLARKAPHLVTGWFWYLGMLIPVIGLIQVGTQSMADRYTYLPLIGVFIMVVWCVGDVLERWQLSRFGWRLVGAVTLLVLGACGLGTMAQVRVWQNSETLFRHAAAVTRNNEMAYYNLGFYCFSEGRGDEAIAYYRKALQIKPKYDDALNNLGIALATKGELDEGIGWIREAIRLRPNKADAHYNLGNALVMQRKFDEAMQCYTEALRLKPAYAEAHNNLANLLVMQGRKEEAAQHYREVLRLKPEHEEAKRQLRALGLPLP